MKFWTYEQTVDWLTGKPDKSISIENVLLSGPGTYELVNLPKSSDEQAHLSNAILATMEPFTGCVFVLTEWGVCEDYDDRIVIDRIRASYGESRSFDQVPAFVFDASERDEAQSMLRLFMSYHYDGILAYMDRRTVLQFIGHEDIAYSFVGPIEI